MDTLIGGLKATHAALRQRLDRATTARPGTDGAHVRDQYPAIDTFLAATSRHLGAIVDVIVPPVRTHVPDGVARARTFIEQVRRTELALNQVKAKLYGSTYAIRRPWDSIWSDARRELEATFRLERLLVRDLTAHHQDRDPDWGEELYHAELHAPTRPHPYIPHQHLGHLARSLARRVDGFWDTAEGRMVPEPVRHHDRSADGPLVQWLLADPHLPEDDDEEPPSS